MLDREGLYCIRRANSPACIRQAVLYRGDVWRFAGHLSRMYVYGTRHIRESQARWDERARNGELLSLQCGYVSMFVDHHLSKQGIRSRLVSCVARSNWNGFDDGHTLMEIFDPGEKRYLLFDPTLGARYLKNGRYLDLLEMTRLYRSGGRADKIEFLNGRSKIDPLMNYDAFLATGFADPGERAAQRAKFVSMLTCDVRAIHRWYARVMTIPMIGEYFVVETDDEEKLIRSLPVWRGFKRLSAAEFREILYERPAG